MAVSNFTRALLALSLISSSSVFANGPEQAELKKHTFGGKIATGSVELYDLPDEDYTNVYSYYNYKFDQNFSLEIGLNFGMDASDWECDDFDDGFTCRDRNDSMFNIIGADELEVTNFVIAGKAQLPLSQRNSLYAKVGANFYDYEISRNDRTFIDDSGTGVYLEGGWQYVWDFGLGMDAGVQYFDMGDLDSVSFAIGVSYQF
ncbi:outer membrane beta-barrel protein [Pseudoalteromonas spongiae]|uniref:outer membrane beta-barrel protein n=1 Tax=Pseudoalteromonas spongiae TaxID=298657 RepID=UPI003736F0CF